MQEDLLHHLWKYKKISPKELRTTADEPIRVVNTGQHNLNAGPDFFNAKLRIGDQLWAGNVEIHIKSSDWYLHNHEKDKSYDNVILHVVWEHDTDVFRQDNTIIPTLELKGIVDLAFIDAYRQLLQKDNKWINCEKDFPDVDAFTLNNWLERLYIERLERKSQTIYKLLYETKNNWEAVCFIMLAKNFGLKVNGDAFYSLAKATDFAVVRKSQSDITTMEALLFGQARLLNADIQNGYYNTLVEQYDYLKYKFKLDNKKVLPTQFFRLRPPNFPTIRLSQLANLYVTHKNLFSEIIETNDAKTFYKLFEVSASSFWETHYTFQKTSKPTAKKLSKAFIDLLLINTILPLKFCYAKHKGEAADALVLNMAFEIASEKNSIIDAFNNLKEVSKTALHSQALIQLKTEYCDKNKCLQCAIGNRLITQNS